MANMTTPPKAEFFNNVKTIAVVGVSMSEMKFGSAAYRELKKRGFEVFPLHPSLKTFDGAICYASLADLPVTPDCVLVTVKPAQAEAVVKQTANRGTKKVWFQQGRNVSEAVRLADQLGLQSVDGRCILMYAGSVTGIHKVHRFLNRLFGRN